MNSNITNIITLNNHKMLFQNFKIHGAVLKKYPKIYPKTCLMTYFRTLIGLSQDMSEIVYQSCLSTIFVQDALRHNRKYEYELICVKKE